MTRWTRNADIHIRRSLRSGVDGATLTMKLFSGLNLLVSSLGVCSLVALLLFCRMSPGQAQTVASILIKLCSQEYSQSRDFGALGLGADSKLLPSPAVTSLY
jgi:hypothetical protein